MYSNRVLSGMRPTGRLHLGHYHGVLKNWLRLQNEYQCLFFVADWHALTTHYDTPHVIEENARDMVIDWLAAGVDPAQATLFVQSRVIEHAELHLLLSMMTPLGWLERVPTWCRSAKTRFRTSNSPVNWHGASTTCTGASQASRIRHAPRSRNSARRRPGCTRNAAPPIGKRATTRRWNQPRRC